MSENSVPAPVTTLRKVAACILRKRSADRLYELLLFRHADMPDVPAQIPGGGIDRGEYGYDAVGREVKEESGLTDLRMLRRLGTSRWFWKDAHAMVDREIFLFEAPETTPDTWIHTVTGGGGDCDLRFSFYWSRKPEDLVLSGDLGEFVNEKHIPELYWMVDRGPEKPPLTVP